jgi:hypothetical protein
LLAIFLNSYLRKLNEKYFAKKSENWIIQKNTGTAL